MNAHEKGGRNIDIDNRVNSKRNHHHAIPAGRVASICTPDDDVASEPSEGGRDHFTMHSVRVGGSLSKSLGCTPGDEITYLGG